MSEFVDDRENDKDNRSYLNIANSKHFLDTEIEYMKIRIDMLQKSLAAWKERLEHFEKISHNELIKELDRDHA